MIELQLELELNNREAKKHNVPVPFLFQFGSLSIVL